MKKLLAILALTSLFIATPARAETVECSTSQYGGAVCGVTTDEEVVVTHETVEAGLGDMQITTVIAILGLSALVATGLYKLSYRWYILG